MPKQKSKAVAEPVTESNRFQISRIAIETAIPIQKASMRERSISKSLRSTEPSPMRTTVISTHVAATPSAEAISIYLSPLAQVGDFESSAMCNSLVEDPSYPFQAQNSLIPADYERLYLLHVFLASLFAPLVGYYPCVTSFAFCRRHDGEPDASNSFPFGALVLRQNYGSTHH